MFEQIEEVMMSEKINDGGPAFPGYHLAPGMTLRDYFAGQALQGLCADSELSTTQQRMAKWCFEVADAMLAERAKGAGK